MNVSKMRKPISRSYGGSEYASCAWDSIKMSSLARSKKLYEGTETIKSQKATFLKGGTGVRVGEEHKLRIHLFLFFSKKFTLSGQSTLFLP